MSTDARATRPTRPARLAPADGAADDAGDAAGQAAEPRRHQSLRLLLGLAATVVVVAGMRAFTATLGTVFLALVVVIVLHPLQQWLRRHGTPAWLAATVVILITYGLTLGLLAATALSVLQLVNLLPTYSTQLTALVDSAQRALNGIGVTQAQISQALSSVNTARVVSLAQTALTQISGVLTDLLLFVLLAFFLVIDATPFPTLLAQASRTHPALVTAMSEFAVGTRRFLVVSTVFGLAVALIDVGVLYAIGVPLPWLWGLVAFLTNYVANIGFFLGLLPPALLALLAIGPGAALWVAVAYTLINAVIQGLAQPKIIGNAVGLNPTLTFVSVVFWGFALGSLGALLAVPLSLLVRAVLVDADPRARWLLPIVAGTTRGVHQRGRAYPAKAVPGASGATVAPAEGVVLPVRARRSGTPGLDDRP